LVLVLIFVFFSISSAEETRNNEVLQELIAALKNPQWEARVSAVEKLYQIKTTDKKVVDFLITALEDSVGTVRALAAKAIGQIGNRSLLRIEDIKDWRELLRSLRSSTGVGYQILNLLPNDTQQKIRLMEEGSVNDSAKHIIITGLNEIIERPLFLDFGQNPFEGISLRDETKVLLERSRSFRDYRRTAPLSQGEKQYLARLLFEDAYPNEIAKSQIILRQAIEPLIALLQRESGAMWDALKSGETTQAVKPIAPTDPTGAYHNIEMAAQEALTKITGQNLGPHYKEWQNWWGKLKGGR
jgi:hypothetical protein